MLAIPLLGFLLFAQLQSFDGLLREGLIALQSGDTATANDRLTKATGLKDDSGLAWAALAQARLKIGKADEADQAASKAEAVGVEQANVVQALLIYWSGRGEPEPLIRLARRALESEDVPAIRSLLVKAYLAAGRFDEAETELKRAAETAPIQERYVFDYVQALLNREKFDAAGEALQRATQTFPNSAQLRLALGVTLYGQRRFAEAITEFLKTIDLQPEAEQPYIFLGRILDHAGERLSLIEQRLAMFLESTPDKAWAHLVYAKVLLQRADSDLALVEKHLRHALDQDPPSWEANYQLGLLLVRKRQYEAAAAALQTAIQIKPDEPPPHYHLARVYDRLGKATQAAEQRAVHDKLIRSTGAR